MRTILIFAALILLPGSTSLFAQENLYSFTKDYFRSNPFQGEFSVFLKHLLNDPTIEQKKTIQRTDSSFFSFFGIYKSHSPFFFKPKRVEVSLVEAPFRYADSLPVADTILIYQLMAYAGNDEKSQKEVQKEFERIHRHYNKKFSKSEQSPLSTGGIVTGSIRNYFVAYRMISPMAVAWSKLEKEEETVLILTVRIKLSENQATLPKFLDNP